MRTSPQRKLFVFLSLLVILPISIIAARAVLFNLGGLANPCTGYGAGEGIITVIQGGGCSATVSSSGTIPILLMTGLIPGGMMFGSALGVFGILKTRPVFLLASSVILFLESIPLLFGGLFVLALLPAGFFFWAGGTKGLSH